MIQCLFFYIVGHWTSHRFMDVKSSLFHGGACVYVCLAEGSVLVAPEKRGCVLMDWFPVKPLVRSWHKPSPKERWRWNNACSNPQEISHFSCHFTLYRKTTNLLFVSWMLTKHKSLFCLSVKFGNLVMNCNTVFYCGYSSEKHQRSSRLEASWRNPWDLIRVSYMICASQSNT